MTTPTEKEREMAERLARRYVAQCANQMFTMEQMAIVLDQLKNQLAWPQAGRGFVQG